VASLRAGRCFTGASATVDNQFIYVFGGYDGKPIDSIERYDVVRETWESVGCMPEKRFMHASICLE